MLTDHSIQYANGLDWEERRKFLYPTLRDEFLEGYIPCFIKVCMYIHLNINVATVMYLLSSYNTKVLWKFIQDLKPIL